MLKDYEGLICRVVNEKHSFYRNLVKTKKVRNKPYQFSVDSWKHFDKNKYQLVNLEERIYILMKNVSYLSFQLLKGCYQKLIIDL